MRPGVEPAGIATSRSAALNSTVVPAWLRAFVDNFSLARSSGRPDWRFEPGDQQRPIWHARLPHKPRRCRSALPRPSVRYSDV